MSVRRPEGRYGMAGVAQQDHFPHSHGIQLGVHSQPSMMVSRTYTSAGTRRRNPNGAGHPLPYSQQQQQQQPPNSQQQPPPPQDVQRGASVRRHGTLHRSGTQRKGGAGGPAGPGGVTGNKTEHKKGYDIVRQGIYQLYPLTGDAVKPGEAQGPSGKTAAVAKYEKSPDLE